MDFWNDAITDTDVSGKICVRFGGTCFVRFCDTLYMRFGGTLWMRLCNLKI